jgi:hypothetical protein
MCAGDTPEGTICLCQTAAVNVASADKVYPSEQRTLLYVFV